MSKRFRTLRVVVVILQVMGWVALGAGTLASLGAIVGGLLWRRVPLFGALLAGSLRWPPLSPAAIGLAWGIVFALASILYFVIFYAASEFIQLALAIEESTRQTAEYLRGEGDSSVA
jgi:hypothetical protein